MRTAERRPERHMPHMPPGTPILVVDDSAAIRSRMEAYLQRLGFTNVQTAATLAEGLTKFREQSPEVVFLDLVIDEDRGADFAAEALAERPFATIVVMTALPPSHEYVTAAIAEGAREYLPKPIQFPAVRAVLDHIDETISRERLGLPREDPSYG